MGPDLLRADLAEFLPQFGLRLAHRGLLLVPPTDAELVELAAIVAEPGGILAPGQEHFVSWPTGSPEAAQAFLRRHWDLRVRPRRDAWHAPFAVELDGRVLGVATLSAASPPGVVETRTWLARPEQGAGVGRRVRLMLLDLAFTHLGASRAVAAAAVGNAAARRVSARCGYRETETVRRPDLGERSDGRVSGVDEVSAAVTPGAWRRRRLADVLVVGVDAFAAALCGRG